ncbi:PREDICTED: carbonic anhydrase 9 [Chinchilla lanigera]|uniref:carbonic anhydrase 9 n=1 Tax=Chinchilla lanigera TaxID=34839 RepID=UPI00038E9447|nr:PREDICTED: carbonic anhydrase 9 [Chinchilla lanigera]
MLHVQPVHTVSWDTPVNHMASLGPSPWLPLLISAPAVQLLLLLLLLVPSHPQNLSWMQGDPSMEGDSSGESDPLGEADRPREEDPPGGVDPHGEGPPQVHAKPGEQEEDPLKLEDLPTVATPEGTQGHQNNGHGDKKGAAREHWRYGGTRAPLPASPGLRQPASSPRSSAAARGEQAWGREGCRGRAPSPPRSPRRGRGGHGRQEGAGIVVAGAGRPAVFAVYVPPAFPEVWNGGGLCDLHPEFRPLVMAQTQASVFHCHPLPRSQEGPEENGAYEQLLSRLDEITEEGSEIWIPGLDVSALLPSDLSRYFQYEGSLTTPPCSQGVIWTVFNQTVKLSARQLHALTGSLWGPRDARLQLNFRATQPLNGRVIEASFPAEAHSSPAPVHMSSCFTTGDILALIFGLLFAATSIAFLVQMRKQHRHRSGTKKGVSYSPAEMVETGA